MTSRHTGPPEPEKAEPPVCHDRRAQNQDTYYCPQSTTQGAPLQDLHWQPVDIALDPPDPALVLATVRAELERRHPGASYRLEVDTTLWTGEDDGTTYDLVFEPVADSPDVLAIVATMLEAQAPHNGGNQTFVDSYDDGWDPIHMLVLGDVYVARVILPHAIARQLAPWVDRLPRGEE